MRKKIEVYESVFAKETENKNRFRKAESRRSFARKRFVEEVDVGKIIGDVIDTDWSKDNESQMKVVNLLKGIATSDEAVANEFMKKLDDFTSGLDKAEFAESEKEEMKEEDDDETEEKEEPEESDDESDDSDDDDESEEKEDED